MEYNQAAKIIQSYWRLKHISWLICKEIGVKTIKEHLDYDFIFRFIVEPLRYNKPYWKFKNDLILVIELNKTKYNQAAKTIQTYWRLKYMSWIIYKKIGVKRIKEYLDIYEINEYIINHFKSCNLKWCFSQWFSGGLEEMIEYKIRVRPFLG